SGCAGLDNGHQPDDTSIGVGPAGSAENLWRRPPEAPMSLHRFRLRTLMIAMAIISILLAGYVAFHRARRQNLARYRARHERQLERANIIAIRESGRAIGRDELAQWNRVWTVYHGMLRQKYENAVSHPWASIPPDPPDPIFGKVGREVDLHFND